MSFCITHDLQQLIHILNTSKIKTYNTVSDQTFPWKISRYDVIDVDYLITEWFFMTKLPLIKELLTSGMLLAAFKNTLIKLFPQSQKIENASTVYSIFNRQLISEKIYLRDKLFKRRNYMSTKSTMEQLNMKIR